MRQNKAQMTRSRDQIAQTQQVRTLLKDLSRLFQEMEGLYSKEARKKRSKLGPEELETRTQFLQQFKRELETLKRLASKASSVTGGEEMDLDLETGAGASAGAGAGASGAGFDTAGFFQSLTGAGAGAGAAGAGASGGGGKGAGVQEVELTEFQQQGLQQIESRDAQFDEILDQIGAAVELAGEKAKVIGDEMNVQNEMLEKVEVRLEETRVKLDSINVKMKENLEDKGMGMERFCINLMCFVLLLGVIGIIINVL